MSAPQAHALPRGGRLRGVAWLLLPLALGFVLICLAIAALAAPAAAHEVRTHVAKVILDPALQAGQETVAGLESPGGATLPRRP